MHEAGDRERLRGRRSKRPGRRNFPNNYSPTALLIQAMGADASRTVDYVAPIAFVDAAGYDKARGLALSPVP